MILATIIAALMILGLSFLITAGVTALVLWLLAELGFVVIAFSWKLVLLVWIILGVLRSIFKTAVNE